MWWRGLLAGLGWTLAAQASSVVALGPADLAARAELVVRGTVGEVSTQVDDGARLVTVWRLAVRETWKGAASAEVEVRVPGGVLGDLEQRVEGVERAAPGEELVVFLERGRAGWRTVGLAQGVFHVSAAGEAVPSRVDLRFIDARTGLPTSGPVRRALAISDLRGIVRVAGRSR